MPRLRQKKELNFVILFNNKYNSWSQKVAAGFLNFSGSSQNRIFPQMIWSYLISNK
jgi:hypothetical protein